jgi:hypothetical protein
MLELHINNHQEFIKTFVQQTAQYNSSHCD